MDIIFLDNLVIFVNFAVFSLIALFYVKEHIEGYPPPIVYEPGPATSITESSFALKKSREVVGFRRVGEKNSKRAKKGSSTKLECNMCSYKVELGI